MSDDQKPLLQQNPPPSAPPGYTYGHPQPNPQVGVPPPAYGAPPPPQYPPPQNYGGGYQAAAPYQAPPTPIVVNTGGVYFGSVPVQMRCSNCQKDIMTKVNYEAGTLTWLSVGVFFILGFFILISWCLCWIPLIMDGLKDVVHTCPNCNNVCGVNRKI